MIVGIDQPVTRHDGTVWYIRRVEGQRIVDDDVALARRTDIADVHRVGNGVAGAGGGRADRLGDRQVGDANGGGCVRIERTTRRRTGRMRDVGAVATRRTRGDGREHNGHLLTGGKILAEVPGQRRTGYLWFVVARDAARQGNECRARHILPIGGQRIGHVDVIDGLAVSVHQQGERGRLAHLVEDRTRAGGLGQQHRRQRRNRDVAVDTAADVLVRIVGESQRAMIDVHHVGDGAATEILVDRGAIFEYHALIGQQFATFGRRRIARGGAGADAEIQRAVCTVRRHEFGKVRIDGIGLSTNVCRGTVILQDLDAARHISQARRNRIAGHDADGAVLALVMEIDGVFDDVARMQIRSRRTTDLGRELLQRGHHVRAVQIGHEHQRVREIDVLARIERQRGLGRIVADVRLADVGRAVGNVDQLEVHRELVDVIGVLVGEVRTQPGDAAVPEVVGVAVRVTEVAAADHVRPAQLEMVTAVTFIALPDQRAHVGGEVADRGRQQAIHRDGRRVGRGDGTTIAIEHHQATERLAGILVNDDQAPAAVGAHGVRIACHRGQTTDVVVTVACLLHQRGDIGVCLVWPVVVVRIAVVGDDGQVADIGRDGLVRDPTRLAQINRPAIRGLVPGSRGAPAPVQPCRQYRAARRHRQRRTRRVAEKGSATQYLRQIGVVDVDKAHRATVVAGAGLCRRAVGRRVVRAGQQGVADHLDITVCVGAEALRQLCRGGTTGKQ